MSESEQESRNREAAHTTIAPPVNLREATWRFQGDRAAADIAYCARFGVRVPPEPVIAPGGAWAYALPPTEPPR